jgi:tetratricopeptide (TPR) repeat protein
MEEAVSYYQKAMDSLDNNVEDLIIAELYCKYALAHDDKNDTYTAFDYYNKCLTVPNNPFKALAYSNMASCYYDMESYDEALACFKKAYELEKENNNYDGIYYTASRIAKIYLKEDLPKSYDYLIEAKKSAEFINEDFYILESTIALGDYYYNYSNKTKECLKEYFKALNLAQNFINEIDINIIKSRIEDMKHRMDEEDFAEIESKYAK